MQSEAGGRKESEKITRAVQAKQAAEKRAKRKRGPYKRSRRPKRERIDNEGRASATGSRKESEKITRAVQGCTGLCRAVLAVLGCAWLCLAMLGCAWLAFVNLKLRFPFACCTGFGHMGAHVRSKIDLKHDKTTHNVF